MKAGKNNKKSEIIDMIGSDELKTSADVRHLAVSCSSSSIAATINDLISIYGSGADTKTIIFCQTKSQVDELAISPKLTQRRYF